MFLGKKEEAPGKISERKESTQKGQKSSELKSMMIFI